VRLLIFSVRVYRVQGDRGKDLAMDVKVGVLDDNIAGVPPFRAEHGLSVWLEVDGRSFLWDCGQTDLAVFNARALGIDLRLIEGIGVSHGHLDHAGGLLAVLQAAGRKKLYAHPDAWLPRYLVAGDAKVFVGIAYRLDAIESMCESVVLSREPVEVMPGVSLTGEVPRVTDFEGPEPLLFIEKDGNLIPDPFTDDQALVVDTTEGAVVLTGCAHSGIINILKHAIATSSSGRIRAVVGGTHLGMGAPVSKVEVTMDHLEELAPDRMIFNHCTGSVVMSRMQDRFKGSFIPGATGLMVEL
jgi:7,8-dihydropterin-6-yl-methyl-4-(beta-D-ribofuranosyl)aminobenzene 5'-phosphate synthase